MNNFKHNVEVNKLHNHVKINVDEMVDDEIFILFKLKNDFPCLERIRIKKEESKSINNFYFDRDFSYGKKYYDFIVDLPEIMLNMQYRQDRYATKDIDYMRVIESSMKQSLNQYEQTIIQNAQLQVKPKGFDVKTLLFKVEDDILVEDHNNIKNGVFYPSVNYIKLIRHMGLVMYRTEKKYIEKNHRLK